jgi:hypothetical protein
LIGQQCTRNSAEPFGPRPISTDFARKSSDVGRFRVIPPVTGSRTAVPVPVPVPAPEILRFRFQFSSGTRHAAC